MNRRLARTTLFAALLTLTNACGEKKTEAKGESASSATPTKSGDAPSGGSAKPAPSSSAVANAKPPVQSGPAPGGTSAASATSLHLFSKPKSGVTVTVDKTTVSTGDVINVTFGAALHAPEGQRYWLTLAKAGSPDSEYGAWHYVADDATTDTLKAGAEGEYEVRLHDIYPANAYKVMSRAKVTVKCEGAECGKAAPPEAPPPPEPPKPTSDGYLADGWPAEIPARGSKVPTVDEWNAVTKEVTVWHSSDLKCETKMIREWLRVSCHKNTYGGPTNVEKVSSDGQQNFLFHSSEVASLVLEVLPGKTYLADFSWEQGLFRFALAWPNGGRPQASFYLPGDE